MLERLKETKRVHQRIRDTVFGYVRESEALFSPNRELYEIPPLIPALCTLFYYEKETFVPAHDAIMTINAEQTEIASPTILLTESRYLYQENMASGSVRIDPQTHPSAVFVWTLRLTVSDRIRIGLL